MNQSYRHPLLVPDFGVKPPPRDDEPSTVVTCVFCGAPYPSGTPTHGAQILTEHIRVCEKHPMRKLESDNAKLRSALVGLVGADTKEELEGMEGAIRLLPMPERDRAQTLNAIHALLDTLSQRGGVA